MKKLLAIGLIAIMLFGLVGCGNTLNGTYKSTGAIGYTFTFNPEGSVTFSAFGVDATGTYTIENGNIIISYELLGTEMNLVKGQFKKSGNSIFIDDTEYIKQ